MATIGSLLLGRSSDASELAADTTAAARGAPFFSTSSVQLLGEYLCIVERAATASEDGFRGHPRQLEWPARVAAVQNGKKCLNCARSKRDALYEVVGLLPLFFVSNDDDWSLSWGCFFEAGGGHGNANYGRCPIIR